MGFKTWTREQDDRREAEREATRLKEERSRVASEAAKDERYENIRKEEAATRKAEELAEQKRIDDLITVLRDEIKSSSIPRTSYKPRSSARLPMFDMEKDKSTFFTWKVRWEYYLTAHDLASILDPDECKKRCMAELAAAMSDNTLKWIGNQNFTED